MTILNFSILLLKLLLCGFLLKPIMDLFLRTQVHKQLRMRFFEICLALLASLNVFAQRIEIKLLKQITHL